jgi:hypothetical protein
MGALMIKRPAAGYLPPGYTPPLNAQVIPLFPRFIFDRSALFLFENRLRVKFKI